MRSFVLVVLVVLVACGPVKDARIGDDAPTGGDAPIEDSPPQIDGCVAHVGVTVEFQVTQDVGSGTSSLDAIVQQQNSYSLAIPAWTEEVGIDQFGGSQANGKSAIKASASFTVTYGGTNKALLDNEVGSSLAVGGAFRQAQVELVDDNSVFLYLLPTDTTAHPYMDTRCNNAPFTVTNGFPVLSSFDVLFCTVTFFDFRPNTQKNIVSSQNASFHFDYSPCN